VQNALDQFYTKREIATACWQHFEQVLSGLNRNSTDLFFIEPAAGTGAFYEQLPPHRRIGMDLMPKCDGVKTQDFLKLTDFPTAARDTVVIGNPPFGKRAKLAIAFFNQAARFADIVAFILPIGFRKFTTHKHLDPNMRFISRLPLPRAAFHLATGRTYSVNTEFQIWTRFSTTYLDMRQYKPLPIDHPHFQIWQYNNTSTALKVFQNSFDFAVPCQGWQDYSRRGTDARRCERTKQWILLKASNPHVLSCLLGIDYEQLARESGTAVPGFRKGDVVKAYTDKYESTQKVVLQA